MTRISIISLIISVLFLLFILEQVRKKRLQEAYSLLWVIMGLIFIGFASWLKGLDYVSSLFGIYYSPAFLFLILIVTLFLICIQFSMVLSKRSTQIKILTQELALMKNELDKLRNYIKDNKK